jgi:uncharacterized phiE125 gp8 family phage protein
MYGLKQTVAPTQEPVSVYFLKQHLRIQTNTEDALLAMYITSARKLFEEWTQRQFMTAGYTLYLDNFARHERYGWYIGTMYFPVSEWPNKEWWQRPILLPKPPLQTVTSVQYYDGTDTLRTLDPSTYSVDGTREPARIVLRNFPTLTGVRVPRVMVNYTAGYTQVPSPLVHGIMLLASDMYRNREATTENRYSEMPLGFQGILDAYKVFVLDEYFTETTR